MAPGFGPSWITASRIREVKADLVSRNEEQISLYSNAELMTEVDCAEAGSYQILVRGRSSPAKGGFAQLKILVDGKTIGTSEIRSESEGVFPAGTARLKAGPHRIDLLYQNDLYSPPEDRNLFLSGLGFRRE